MTIENPKQFEAAKDFNQAIIAGLANEKGVHAETAISAAARMAGAYLLRSTGLPLENYTAGTPILVDLVDEKGQELMGLIGQALASMEVPYDETKVNYDLAPEHSPLMDLMETETKMDAPFREVAEKYELTDEQAAASLAISAAILIQNCAGFLDPHVAYVVATYGMVEGAKTVPFGAAEVVV
jgi:hypothetical protein